MVLLVVLVLGVEGGDVVLLLKAVLLTSGWLLVTF